MLVEELVALVLVGGFVDLMAVELVDGPCHVLRAHHGAVHRHTVQRQQPIPQHAHPGHRKQHTTINCRAEIAEVPNSRNRQQVC